LRREEAWHGLGHNAADGAFLRHKFDSLLAQ
jgi:hypothetical protein